MADFSKFKIGNTSYNVKDAAAGKSLSISGTDLSLKNAAGTAISTVTIPAGSKYAILTLSDVGSDIACTYVDSSEAVMGTASALIDLIKAGGVAYINYNGVIYAINNCLDGSDPGVSGYELKAESNGYGYGVSDVSNFNLVNSIWTAITPGGGGGSAASVLVLADASQWPVQSSNNLLHLIYQGDPATLLVIRNLYNSAVIPVSAYCITVNNGGVSTHYTDLSRLVTAESVGTPFDLEVWLVAGVQSNQMHKITFGGIIDTGSTITLQQISGFAQSSVIGA